jgi:hypothetical protein
MKDGRGKVQATMSTIRRNLDALGKEESQERVTQPIPYHP